MRREWNAVGIQAVYLLGGLLLLTAAGVGGTASRPGDPDIPPRGR